MLSREHQAQIEALVIFFFFFLPFSFSFSYTAVNVELPLQINQKLQFSTTELQKANGGTFLCTKNLHKTQSSSSLDVKSLSIKYQWSFLQSKIYKPVGGKKISSGCILVILCPGGLPLLKVIEQKQEKGCLGYILLTLTASTVLLCSRAWTALFVMEMICKLRMQVVCCQWPHAQEDIVGNSS